MKQRLLILLSALWLSKAMYAGSSPDDYAWWNKQFHWDGHSIWRNYMRASAAYFGPNALPVPELNRAIVSSSYRFELRPEGHFSTGDRTWDIYTSLKIPLDRRVDFEVFIVPYERFKMDTATRNKRVVRHIDASGSAGGDFWFGTNFKILDQKHFPLDLVASFYFKTASGTGLDYARYTDTPGYYMHLAFGKDIGAAENGKERWRIYGHGGVYIYQTWSTVNPQMDAMSWGGGVQYAPAPYFLRCELAGYYGYWNDGDRPAVFRFKSGTSRQGLNIELYFQQGLHDFLYRSVGLAMVYSIKASQDSSGNTTP